MDPNAPYSDISEEVWPFVDLASSITLEVAKEDGRPTLDSESGRVGETSARRKMFSKEQWFALKPVIKRLYVDEGQTFGKVAEYLYEHHGFKPTKKQFLRRISEWGFEKNVKKEERRRILNMMEGEVRERDFEIRMVRGRRLDRAKIERWRKREGMIGFPNGFTDNSATMDDPSHLYENEIPAPRRKEPWNKNNLIEEMPRQGSHPESNVMDQEQTFNPWLAVDVVGSPGLTGLIGALTLDCCESIPDLDLSEPCSEVTQAEWDFVERGQESSTVIDQDPPRENQPPKTDCGPISTSVSALSTGFLHQRQHYMLGPLSEVDPFPRVVLQKSLFKNPRTDHLISAYSLRAKEIECRARFKALDSMKRVDILKLVEDMRSLCWRQYELDQYDLAESWSRCVVTSTLKISDIHPTKVLYACLDVLDLLRVRGKFKEALGLHPMVHDQIMKLVRPDHDLAILSRLIFAEIQNGLHEYEHEVSVCREVLQLCLLRFGTKSRDTLHILVNLAIALGRTGQYKEAETLSHIQIQLDYEVSKYTGRDAVDNLNALVSMVTLARCFTYQGKYDDSASVLHTAETCFENVIGAKNSYTWHHSFEKAEMLRRMGRLLESEEILRAQLEHAPESAYEDVRLGLKFLADLLIETGRENEVIVLWEKMFSLDIEMFGIEHKISRADCKKLGFSYAELGRYDDALIHFRRTSEQLNLSRSRDPDSHDTHLKEIQDWILAVENMKEQARTTGSQPVVEGVPPPVDSEDCDEVITKAYRLV